MMFKRKNSLLLYGAATLIAAAQHSESLVFPSPVANSRGIGGAGLPSTTKVWSSDTADDTRVEEEVEAQVDNQEKELSMAGTVQKEPNVEGMPDFLASLKQKVGDVEDDRLVYPELQSGEVPRLFSSLKYEKSDDGKFESGHAEGSVFGAAALVAGTTIGAGVLALPTATAAAGFIPSTAAMGVAWLYMTISGLLIAELTLNRIVTTGRPGLGLLDLYKNSLGKSGSRVGSGAYFFLHYAIMVAYIAQGGTNVAGFLESLGGADLAAVPGAGQILFASICGITLFAASSRVIETINNALVVGVIGSFCGIVAFGAGKADLQALVDPAAQHPDQVISCFPILFLSLVYQNVVPSVCNQLEGDRTKIAQSIVAGTTIPLFMFLAFNAVVLGNALSTGVDLTSGVNPVSLLEGNAVGSLVTTFSTLAVITSLIGFTYGLLDAWTDVFNIPSEGKEFEKAKVPLYLSIFLPPLALSVTNPDIFYTALDYAGAFGVSTLFLVLPPWMVWNERYGEDKTPLAAKPIVPFGKIPLAALYKAAGTLIVEQGLEKLGLLDFLGDLSSTASA